MGFRPKRALPVGDVLAYAVSVQSDAAVHVEHLQQLFGELDPLALAHIEDVMPLTGLSAELACHAKCVMSCRLEIWF